MEILLTNKDLEFIDGLIKKTPFEFANPFYNFFVAKIQEVAQAGTSQSIESSVTPDLGGETAENTSAPKKKSALKKV